jgi:NADH-quinone oxidoreductase subunit D
MSTAQNTPPATKSTFTMNFGPQHPATHGTLHLVLELDGERIERCDPQIGYLHTGFEKLGEYRSLTQFVTLTDRLNYMSPLANNIGLVYAAERMLGVEPTPRCVAIRVVLAELSRIADHIVCCGLAGMDLGAFSVMLWCFEERERLYDIFEAVTGTRLTTSYTRVGGLARDVHEGFEPQVRVMLERIPALVVDVKKMLARNRIFTDRMHGVGRLTLEQCEAFGVTGPVARAAGLEYDVRKAMPYYGYDRLDWDMVISTDADCYARFNVRLQEILESVKIIRQVMDAFPDGPVNVDDPKIVLPPKQDVYTKMESLIHHFKLIMDGHGLKLPAGKEFYAATEAPNGELGFFLSGDGTMHPLRIRVRAPSFYNYQPMNEYVKGHTISDILSVLSTLNIIAGELDR